MKTKAKLTLAISVLSAVVLAAGATSTFAWFVVRSSVTATSGTLTVKSPSSLTIKGYDLVEGEKLTPDSDSATAITGSAASLGSVSSQYGKDFYAPADWTAASPSMVAVSAVTKNPYTGYIQYSIAVTAAKGEANNHLKAYVTVNETNATANQLKSWYRVGVYHVGTIVEDDTDYSKEAPTSAGAVTASTAKVYGSSAVDDDSYWDGTQKKSDRDVVAVGSANAISLSSFTTQTGKDVTAYFVVAVWMEGYASANQNSAGGQSIVVTANFELYK